MKKIILSFLFLLNVLIGLGQVGIGTSTVNANAAVDMSKTTKGLLMPRLTQSARLNISNPAEGLMIYDTTLNRTYQYQDGVWRYLLNNTVWLRSATPNTKYIYSFDSIGIGATSPDNRLEVNGNIRTRSSLIANDEIKTTNILKGANLITSGNVTVSGTATVAGNITTQASLVVDDATPIVQLKSSGVNKGFLQANGNDLRLGTNSGNTTGKTIIKMDGVDIISIDTSSTFKVLIGGTGGNISTGMKVARQIGPDENMLPILFGKVYGNNSQAWMSTNGTITNPSTGTYNVLSYSARISGRATILVTVAGTVPLIATAVYECCDHWDIQFIVKITNPFTGALTNADFNFIVLDPLNISN